jgi:hypothetical protein
MWFIRSARLAGVLELGVCGRRLQHGYIRTAPSAGRRASLAAALGGRFRGRRPGSARGRRPGSARVPVWCNRDATRDEAAWMRWAPGPGRGVIPARDPCCSFMITEHSRLCVTGIFRDHETGGRTSPRHAGRRRGAQSKDGDHGRQGKHPCRSDLQPRPGLTAPGGRGSPEEASGPARIGLARSGRASSQMASGRTTSGQTMTSRRAGLATRRVVADLAAHRQRRPRREAGRAPGRGSGHGLSRWQ